MKCNEQAGSYGVTLSPSLRSRVNSAKGLAQGAQRCFASLSMTGPVLGVTFHHRAGVGGILGEAVPTPSAINVGPTINRGPTPFHVMPMGDRHSRFTFRPGEGKRAGRGEAAGLVSDRRAGRGQASPVHLGF